MKSSKIFLGLAILFVILMAIASYDISTRTTFPGSKPQLKERIKKQLKSKDTVVQGNKSGIKR